MLIGAPSRLYPGSVAKLTIISTVEAPVVQYSNLHTGLKRTSPCSYVIRSRSTAIEVDTVARLAMTNEKDLCNAARRLWRHNFPTSTLQEISRCVTRRIDPSCQIDQADRLIAQAVKDAETNIAAAARTADAVSRRAN